MSFNNRMGFDKCHISILDACTLCSSLLLACRLGLIFYSSDPCFLLRADIHVLPGHSLMTRC
jgi:hypothetical protein